MEVYETNYVCKSCGAKFIKTGGKELGIDPAYLTCPFCRKHKIAKVKKEEAEE